MPQQILALRELEPLMFNINCTRRYAHGLSDCYFPPIGSWARDDRFHNLEADRKKKSNKTNRIAHFLKGLL